MSRDEDRRAHGDATVVEHCVCGFERRTNVNGRHEERGDWHPSGALLARDRARRELALLTTPCVIRVDGALPVRARVEPGARRRRVRVTLDGVAREYDLDAPGAMTPAADLPDPIHRVWALLRERSAAVAESARVAGIDVAIP